MSERKSCIKCDRAIDAWSKICPFCNWDQGQPAPPRDAAPRVIETSYVPQDDLKEQIKQKGFFALGGVLVLVAAFLVGMVINSDGAPDDAPVAVSEQKGQPVIPPVKRADTPLVPTNERGGIEQPITSAPVAAAEGSTPSGYERSDATAVSSVEYNDLAKRAKAERERMSVLVDPRNLSGAAYAQGRPPAAPQPRRVAPLTDAQEQQQAAAPQVSDNRPRRAIRTRPVPQYQPIPRILGSGTARLTLIIGSDGRVRDVNIEKALNRDTAELVAAVHRWRFKPATEDGEPVSAPYSVDISFGGQ